MNFAALPHNLESTFVSYANPYLPVRLTRFLSFARNSFIGLGAENPSVGAPMQIISYSLSELSVADNTISLTLLQRTSSISEAFLSPISSDFAILSVLP